MRNLAKKIFVLLVLSMIVLLFMIKSVEAEEKNNPSIPFSVTPILPDNQDKSVKGYFRLQVEPKEKQKIYVLIKNSSNKKVTLHAVSSNASTAPNGGIQYLEPNENDETLFLEKAYQLADNVTIKKEITLQPNEQQKVPVEVNVPNLKEGTALGGLLFYDTEEDNIDQVDSKKEGAAFYIKNKFVFALAIQLDINKPVKPKFSFDKAGVRFIPSGIQLWFDMKNDSAAVLEGEKGHFDVYDSRNHVVFSDDINIFKMAPKTHIQYPVFWGSKEVKSGKYTIKMTAKVNGKTIKHETSFTVKRKEIKEYNKSSGFKTPMAVLFPTWAIVLMTLGGVLVIGLLGWGIRIFIKRKHDQNQSPKE